MILSIGEILADLVGEEEKGGIRFEAFAGGAPFNLAVNAKQAGAKVGFLGRVGNDVIGRFLLSQTKKAALDFLELQIDEKRNTTLAFVTLTNGERDFAFNRHDTADYHIDFSSVNFEKYEDLTLVHLGSLMLSEKEGREFAKKVAEKVKALSLKLSFDLNFRADLYPDFEQAKEAYTPFIQSADIVKFSEEELLLYTGERDTYAAVKSFYRNGQIILVTLGSKGCYYYFDGISGIIPSKKVTPIDTTGAGDAFFGTFLAEFEKSGFSKDKIEQAIQKANERGAYATQFKGAIQL